MLVEMPQSQKNAPEGAFFSSLVRGAKSPTSSSEPDERPWKQRYFTDIEKAKRINAIGTKAVFERREWSNEYRVRFQSELCSMQSPPVQSGDRVTKRLSDRATRKIIDSALYTAAKKGGFSTFITFTVRPEFRDLAETGELQKHLSRTIDAMQKMFQRGWVAKEVQRPDKTVKPCKRKINAKQHEKEYLNPETGEAYSVCCIGENKVSEADYQRFNLRPQKLDYIWVMEMPKNEQGENNPHFHMLLRWTVDKKYFRAWAKRIEEIWKLGFAKIEKVRSQSAAGQYILKMAGYLSKGSDDDSEQGTIKGNRYNISKTARAPAWEILGQAEWGIMGYILKQLTPVVKSKRRRLKPKLKECKETLKNRPRRLKSRLTAKLLTQLNKVEKEFSQVSIAKNCVILKTKAKFDAFMQWAQKMGYEKKEKPPCRGALIREKMRRRYEQLKKYAFYEKYCQPSVDALEEYEHRIVDGMLVAVRRWPFVNEAYPTH